MFSGIVLLLALVAAQDMQVFDEDVDVDSIIDNDRILDTYLRCFYGITNCSDRGQRVKDMIPTVLETVCDKCTLKQRRILHHTLNVFIPKRPNDWKKLLEIYDPDGKFAPAMNAFINGPEPTV